MAITFDGSTKIITLDSASVSAQQIWSRWVDWHTLNLQWPLALKQVGGDSLGSGLFIPPYFFLQNGWRVRPMELSHTLVITGNLFVEGGGNPVVQTLGNFNVSVQYTVPVQAQGIATSGSAIDYSQVANSVWAKLIDDGYSADQLVKLMAAALLGKVSGAGTGVETFRSVGDTANRVVSNTDENGNRTDVTLSP